MDEPARVRPAVNADPAVAYAIADIGGRDAMEDEHVLGVESVRPLRVLGAVFDGHGGSAVARLARDRFPSLFLSSLTSGPEAAFRGAFAAIHRESLGLPGGAVAAVFYIEGGKVWAANVGDAHVALVSGGQATRLTEDHRITNEVELRRVVAAGAEIWGPYVCLEDGTGIMPTRALGDHAFERVGVLHEAAVSFRSLTPGFLVGACDGLWDVMGTEEVPGILAGTLTAKEAAERLAHEALHGRATSDNLTVLVVRVE